jgi:DNA-3-methyladenine glycosylase II
MLELIDNEKVINDAFEHLSHDKVMEFFINSFGDKINPNDRYNSNYAISICNLIIEQQISFKAAISIKKKFFNLIDGKSNSEILKIPDDKIQSIGLSFRKVEYIKNVLIFFRDNKININEMSNDEITKSLISIKGIGKWTCEMFLMFVCLRKDIFSFGDLALINSMKKNYCIDDLNLLKSVSEKWKPYRTIAALLLWYSIENNIYFQPNSSL